MAHEDRPDALLSAAVPVIDLAILALGFGYAFLVGVTSIGGVLVLPALVVLLGLPPHQVIPAAMVSFILPAALTLVLIYRRGGLDLWAGAVLWAGAIPGALLGAVILPWVPVTGLLWGIAAMLAMSAARVLMRPRAAAGERTTLPAVELGAAGVLVGVISALTGTGGPITLMPILGWRGVEPRRAVMLCQTITFPTVLFASLGYAWSLAVDWRLAILLAISAIAGVAAGVAVAPRVKIAALARLIGVMMAVSAALLVVRLISG